MASNSNGRVSSSSGDGTNDPKLVGFTPSVPMWNAWNAFIAQKWAEKRIGDTTGSIGEEIEKGFRTDQLKLALGTYIGYDMTLEPAKKTTRTSNGFRVWQAVNARKQGEDDKAYKARYSADVKAQKKAEAEAEKDRGAKAIAAMEKLQALVAMGDNPEEALRQALAMMKAGQPLVTGK